MFVKKKILFSAVDWGMGHATRSIALIARLSQDNGVTIGVTDQNAEYFRHFFPSLQQIDLPSYGVRYSSYLPAWLKVLLQWPRIARTIKKEHRRLAELIGESRFDVVISDSRLGLYSNDIPSVLISHQLYLRVPVFRDLANRFYARRLNRFGEIWVPDYEEPGNRLSGELSSNRYLKVARQFIGPLSALAKVEDSQAIKSKYLILLSGPEPQRTILEKKLERKFAGQLNTVFVRGLKRGTSRLTTGPINKVDFAIDTKLAQLLSGAETVICRSGYSTLMDLHILNKKKFILIPTPGQPEQEYLAQWWKSRFGAIVWAQDEIG